jgi:hypothetical protein
VKLAGGSMWPKVLGEFETLRKLQEGYSLARFGDGEFKVAAGGHALREPANKRLAKELRKILTEPHEKCLVGIPTLDPNGPKYSNWLKFAPRCRPYVDMNRTYYSAFISRPDSAPWINTQEFLALFESLWEGKRAVVVCESDDSKIRRAVQLKAREAPRVSCPPRETYAVLPQIEALVLEHEPDVVLISAGPAATCLAHRLAMKGVQAIDTGHAGGFLLKLACSRKPLSA